MNINKIPLSNLDAIRQRLGAKDGDDTSKDHLIEKMSPLELTMKWTGWHLGDEEWASAIIGIYNQFKELEKEGEI